MNETRDERNSVLVVLGHHSSLFLKTDDWARAVRCGLACVVVCFVLRVGRRFLVMLE